MKVKVKICGIRNLESAIVSINAGSDFLGFNFVKSSKRFIEPVIAKKIIEIIKRRTQTVGVFQDAKIDYINYLIDYLNLDLVQLHGNEEVGFINKIKIPVIKTISISNNLNNDKIIMDMRKYKVYSFLIDREKQGEGKMIDLKKAQIIAKKFPVFIAGALNTDNVLSVINTINPVGIDVASGIETNGNLDSEKVVKLIKQAKGADL